MSSTRNVRGDQAGETLVELLVTIAILGIAFAGILAGIGTATISANVHRKAATSETLVRDASELLLDPAVPYVPCATVKNYPIKGLTVPAGYSVEVRSVSYWEGGNPARFAPKLSTCPASDAGVQRLTIAVSNKDVRAATETVDIIKRSS